MVGSVLVSGVIFVLSTVHVLAGSLLWRVDGPSGPSYLFGTIHLPDPSVSEIPAAVRGCLESVGGVWTEVPMDATPDADLVESMLLPDGGRLRDLLTEEEEERFAAVLKELHPAMTPLLFDQYKPLWAVALMTILPVQMEYPLEVPLDSRIWQEAIRSGKEVGSIETVAEQTAVFDSFTIEEQLELFRLTLRDFEVSLAENGLTPTEELLRVYQSADPGEIQRLFAEVEGADSPIYGVFLERLLTERNERFAERIAARIAEGGTWLFAFGAGHLGGPNGVEVLLSAQGLSVAPVYEAGVAATAGSN